MDTRRSRYRKDIYSEPALETVEQRSRPWRFPRSLVYAEYNFPIQKETITGENEDGTTSESTTFKEAPPLMGIKLKDGTVIKNMYMGGGMIGYQNNSSDDYVYAYATDRIIDPDQIAYFLFINDDVPIGEQGMTENNFYEVAVGENQ